MFVIARLALVAVVRRLQVGALDERLLNDAVENENGELKERGDEQARPVVGQQTSAVRMQIADSVHRRREEQREDAAAASETVNAARDKPLAEIAAKKHVFVVVCVERRGARRRDFGWRADEEEQRRHDEQRALAVRGAHVPRPEIDERIVGRRRNDGPDVQARTCTQRQALQRKEHADQWRVDAPRALLVAAARRTQARVAARQQPAVANVVCCDDKNKIKSFSKKPVAGLHFSTFSGNTSTFDFCF